MTGYQVRQVRAVSRPCAGRKGRRHFGHLGHLTKYNNPANEALPSCTEMAAASDPADKARCGSVTGADLTTDASVCEAVLTSSTSDGAAKACAYKARVDTADGLRWLECATPFSLEELDTQSFGPAAAIKPQDTLSVQEQSVSKAFEYVGPDHIKGFDGTCPFRRAHSLPALVTLRM